SRPTNIPYYAKAVKRSRHGGSHHDEAVYHPDPRSARLRPARRRPRKGPNPGVARVQAASSDFEELLPVLHLSQALLRPVPLPLRTAFLRQVSHRQITLLVVQSKNS